MSKYDLTFTFLGVIANDEQDAIERMLLELTTVQVPNSADEDIDWTLDDVQEVTDGRQADR